MIADDQDDAFGFESIRASAKEKIRQIRPGVPPESPDLKRVDDAADSVGFISRERQPVFDAPQRRGRPKVFEATIAINMRAPVGVGQRFQKWCEENRYSYPAGLAEIMKRAGIATD